MDLVEPSGRVVAPAIRERTPTNGVEPNSNSSTRKQHQSFLASRGGHGTTDLDFGWADKRRHISYAIGFVLVLFASYNIETHFDHVFVSRRRDDGQQNPQRPYSRIRSRPNRAKLDGQGWLGSRVRDCFLGANVESHRQ